MPRAKRETRMSESRASNQARMPQTRHVGMLHIPEQIQREARKRGMILRWIAETVEGSPRAVNVQARLMNGWKPVMVDQYPDMATPVLPGQQPEQIIRRGGQILVEKSIKEYQAERAEIDREHLEELRHVNWADGPNDPTMPREDFGSRVDVERVVSQGPAFKE